MALEATGRSYQAQDIYKVLRRSRNREVRAQAKRCVLRVARRALCVTRKDIENDLENKVAERVVKNWRAQLVGFERNEQCAVRVLWGALPLGWCFSWAGLKCCSLRHCGRFRQCKSEAPRCLSLVYQCYSVIAAPVLHIVVQSTANSRVSISLLPLGAEDARV